jgi:hypothetical protein
MSSSSSCSCSCSSKLAILFLGLDQHVEAEELDRIEINLPGVPELLVQEIVANCRCSHKWRTSRY